MNHPTDSNSLYSQSKLKDKQEEKEKSSSLSTTTTTTRTCNYNKNHIVQQIQRLCDVSFPSVSINKELQQHDDDAGGHIHFFDQSKGPAPVLSSSDDPLHSEDEIFIDVELLLPYNLAISLSRLQENERAIEHLFFIVMHPLLDNESIEGLLFLSSLSRQLLSNASLTASFAYENIQMRLQVTNLLSTF